MRVPPSTAFVLALTASCQAYPHDRYADLLDAAADRRVEAAVQEAGACFDGGTSCDVGCANLAVDRANCGACGRACAIDEVCNAGTCRAQPSLDASPDAPADATLDALPPDAPQADVVDVVHPTDVVDVVARDIVVAPVTVSFGETGMTTFAGVTTDTYLDMAQPLTNFGRAATMEIDTATTKSALLRFIVSAIPATATVRSATLHVWTSTGPTALGGVVSISPVLENWLESDATWALRTGPLPWTTPGAGTPMSSGGPIASFSPDAIGTEFIVALPASTVGAWVARPSSNNGLLFTMTSTDGVTLVTHEGPADRRPWLVVQYVP